MKRIFTALLALVLALSLALGAAAATPAQERKADALNHLGLFLGTDKGYELDAGLNRSESVTLLVRMLGCMDEAERGGYAHPFGDVPQWADKIVAYAYEKQLTLGYDAKTFGGLDAVSDVQYITMVLRALGYDDTAETPDFSWSASRDFALTLGLVDSAARDEAFDRGAAVEILWAALGLKLKGGDGTLADRLIGQGVFTEKALREAKTIAAGGSASGGDPAPAPDPGSGEVTWEDYNAMTDAEREAFFDSFKSPEAFMEWLTAAKEKYDREHPVIEVGPDGSIDLGELTGGKN